MKQGEFNFEQNYYRDGAPSVPGDTSEGAADSVKNLIAAMRKRVFFYIRGQEDGSTCDQAEEALGMIHQTCSPRIRELVLGHFIEDTGERRGTRRGRTARVYKELKNEHANEAPECAAASVHP